MQRMVMSMKKKMVCNLDCFNCKHSDCINSKIELSEYRKSESIDKNIISERGQKSNRKLSKLAIEKRKEYRENNPENELSYARAYYTVNRERYKKYRLQNKDRKRAYDKDYREKNKDRITEQKRIYGEKNKERLRERQKEWREKNKDKIRAYQRKYYLGRKSKEN